MQRSIKEKPINYTTNNQLDKNRRKMKNVWILWTGGWDSTFRIVELSLREVIIKPVYCVAPRHNKENEIRAMAEILNKIKKKPLTKATISDITFVDFDDIPIIPEITEAYERIRKKVKIGSQYNWLSRWFFNR